MTKICDERPVECGDPACPCHEWSAKSPSLTYYGHRRLDVGLGEFLESETENVSEGEYGAGIDVSIHPPDCGCDCNECCAICCRACRLNQPHDVIPAAPDFDHEWREAPRGMTSYVEQSVAEYWFLRGRLAGELNQMIEENRVFREMAERRGF